MDHPNNSGGMFLTSSSGTPSVFPPPSYTHPTGRGSPSNPRGSGPSSNLLPQGSKLMNYMNRPPQNFVPQATASSNSSTMTSVPTNGNDNKPAVLTSRLKKLNISGVQEFVPNNASGQGQFKRFGPPSSSSSSASPNRSQTSPSSMAALPSQASTRQTSPPPISSTAADLSAVNPLASDVSAYSEGGTTYFYNPDEMASNPGISTGNNQGSSVFLPDCQVYAGTPSHLASMRVKANLSSSLEDDNLRIEILKRQHVALAEVDAEMYANIPAEVDNFTKLCPLEAYPVNPMNKSNTFGFVTSTYKARDIKSGQFVCLKRIHSFRLVNTKCMALVEKWKKLAHSNLVTLRQVFTTKAFGDHSIVFVYDFLPMAETLMAKHFSSPNQQTGAAFMDPFSGTDGSARPYSQQKNQILRQQAMLSQNGNLLNESTIWTYVIQLTSVLRHVHLDGLAFRVLDPTKILVINSKNSRLMINCCGIFDVLTFDSSATNPMGAMAHYQQEDLISLGKIVLALACNSFLAIQRENLQTSMEIVTSTYSSDLRNLIMYLLTNPTRVKSVNDLMPMIGARFYTQLDAANLRNDVIEDELAKELESSRLFRVVTKLCTVVDRAEMNGDYNWAECGDRYMLKLFRDYVFHQVTEDGRPWLDMSHVSDSLNRLDTGVPEKVCLMSRDEQNVLVVTYSELKQCLERSFTECVHAQRNTNLQQ